MAVAQRRIREKELRKRQILDAAREVFFERGFDGTTIEEIATRSELSKGALYLYFSSKEEIYFTLMREGSSILYEMLEKAAKEDLPADTLLRRIGHAYMQFYERYPAYFRMLFLYLASPELKQKMSPELCASCEEDAKKCLSIVSRTVEKGIRDGLFRPCNSADLAILVWTCQNGIILLDERGDREVLNLDTSSAKLHDLFLESMIVSLKTGR